MRFARSTGGADERTVLEVQGELDIDTTPEFTTQALAALDVISHRGGMLVIDVSRLTFMDCSGVGALLGVRRAAASRGYQVAISGATGSVERLLRLTSIESLFTIDLTTIVLPESEEQPRHITA